MSTDNEVIPAALACIAPILRVADEIQKERPRVAYLCTSELIQSPIDFVGSMLWRKRAEYVDPGNNTYRGRGVSQFKTLLQQRLERDNAPTLASRVKKTDAREIESFYQQYYEHYARAVDQGNQGKQLEDRAQLEKATGQLECFLKYFSHSIGLSHRDSFPVVKI